MSTAIARRNGAAELTFSELLSLSEQLARSNFFGVKDGAQALAKILAGREMGFAPVASLMGVHLIQGRPTISAGLMASAVKGSGKYDYRIHWEPGNAVNNGETTGCQVEFFQQGQRVGHSTFTLADAERAGLAGKDVWKQYRRNMLFARALSNGVRWYCPDVFQGSVYTPEELGAEVDEEGNAVNVVVPERIETVEKPSAEYVAEFEPDRALEDEPLPRRERLRRQWMALEKQAIEAGVPFQRPTRNSTDQEIFVASEQLAEAINHAAEAQRRAQPALVGGK